MVNTSKFTKFRVKEVPTSVGTAIDWKLQKRLRRSGQTQGSYFGRDSDRFGGWVVPSPPAPLPVDEGYFYQ